MNLSVGARFLCIWLVSSLCFNSGKAFAQFLSVSKETEWQAVTRRAANAHKQVLVDFYTTWCGPCKLMDKTVFSQDTVITYLNRHFVNAKIDADSPFGKLMKKKYRVEAYPTYLYLDDELHPIHTVVGAKDAKGFLRESATALNNYAANKPLAFYATNYAAGNRDTAFVRTYLKKLVAANLDSLASPILNEYIAARPRQAIREERNLELLAMYVRSCQDPYFQTILEATRRKIDNTALRLNVEKSYRRALKNCLEAAKRTKDNALFDSVLAIEQADNRNWSKDLTLMHARLDYYGGTKQDSLFDHWLNYYMNKGLRTSVDSLKKNAKYAFTVIYKDQKPGQISEDAFVEKWVASDLMTLSINLNQYAWLYYTENRNQSQLNDALVWSQKACDLLPVAAHHDTYAHLLYRLGRQDAAILQQRKAIQLAEKDNEETDKLIIELNKMVDGKL